MGMGRFDQVSVNIAGTTAMIPNLSELESSLIYHI